MNEAGFEVPAAVVTVTSTRPAPAGATAEHVVWLEHDVGATWPPKWASTWPSELKRLLPVICTLVPAEPDEGLSDVMAGPLGEAVDEDDDEGVARDPAVGGGELRAGPEEESRLRWMV